MYRYGDGTPFPLDENFIETLTAAVEACTNAFDPLTELDDRRDRARDGRRDADRELARLDDLERVIASALAPYTAPPTEGRKAGVTQTVAGRIGTSAKQAIVESRGLIEGRVQQLETQASPSTVGDAIVTALRPFFDAHQLPTSAWIMSWDVRGAEPSADAVCTAGRIAASFTLSPEPYRAPIRVDQLAEGVVVHMMKKGVFGKAKPAPVDLGKYVVVAFERGAVERTITLRESTNKTAPGLRFAVGDAGATWVSISTQGDSEGEPNPLEADDVAPVRQLADRATAAFKDLQIRRTLVDLTFAGQAIQDLEEPRIVPLEVLQQLTPLTRTIRERSRASGELVLKLDIAGGRREELFVPRATLAQQFARLPADYRRAFEDMGITAEQTQPAIIMTRAPAPRADSIVDIETDLTELE